MLLVFVILNSRFCESPSEVEDVVDVHDFNIRRV